MQILDYSAGYPGGSAVHDAGYAGVIRYLRKEGASRVKPLTAGEVVDMRAHDRLIAVVYQHVSKSRVTEGRAAGQHDARWALEQAHVVGIDPRCVYFAVDFDAVPATVAEYFRGTADVLGVGRNGAYGSYKVLEYLFDRGIITYGWQTVAWSGGRREARAHLYQRLGQVPVGGVSCDVNDVLKTDFGQDYLPEDDMLPDEREVLFEAVKRLRSIHTNGFNDVGDAARSMQGDLTWFQEQSAVALAPIESMLATLVASLQDDVTDADVLARLGEHVDAGMNALQERLTTQLEQVRAEAEAARAADRAALEATIREVLGEDNADLAEEIVAALAAKLASA